MSTINYCTRCGQRLVRTHLPAESRERSVCGGCNAVHYENPKLLVWCFAHWQARVVLCRRAHEPARGLWNPPSGFVEAGETLEEAVARELHEEAGLVIPPSQFTLYRVSSIPHMNEVYVGFRAELLSEPVLTAGPEASEVGLFAESDAPFHHLAFREMLADVPQDFFRFLRSGVFPIYSETVRPHTP